MKYRIYLLLLALTMCCTACEKVLDYEGSLEDLSKGSMVINAVAVADTPFVVYLTYADRADKAIVKRYVDFATAMYQDGKSDYQSNEYLKNKQVTNAQVEVQVNGQANYIMNFDEKSMCYKSTYIPQEGDHVVVKAKMGVINTEVVLMNEETLTAEATVPAKPKIEIVGHEVLTVNPYKYINDLTFETDSIMRIQLRIKNTGGNSYYRLRIRGIGMGYSIGGVSDSFTTRWDTHPYYAIQDIFFSDDELFMDSRLTTNFGGWPAFFSNVFSGQLLPGGDYSFVVDSPKVPYSPPYREWMTENGDTVDLSHVNEIPFLPTQVAVELEAITEDYYHFLKSVELYRIANDDANSETILIHGNAVNGWGVLGAMSYDRHTIYYDN